MLRVPSLRAALEMDPSMDVRIADATALSLDNASADLAVAFMSLHDIDAMPAVVRDGYSAPAGPQVGGPVTQLARF
jgi:hypothetical protein